MTSDEFELMRPGSVIADASGNVYVVTEKRAGSLIAAMTVEVSDPAYWRHAAGSSAGRVLSDDDREHLVMGDAIRKHGGLTYVVAFNDSGRSATAVLATKISEPNEWEVLKVWETAAM